MVHDITWKDYFSDNERYADLINGLGCGGRQVVTKGDLQELDTQTVVGRNYNFVRKIRRMTAGRKIKIRDMLRKAAFGVNFAIIGIENQEVTDYAIVLRNMSYDIGEYEKQAVAIRREIRRNYSGLSKGEYLYGFKKDSRLHPVITFILYSGQEPWDGPEKLHDMLDFTDIPDELRGMASDYKINIIEIRKLKDTSIFKTDIRQVFDFIRYSDNKHKLIELVDKDKYYANMEEDAYDVVANYTNAQELLATKKYYEREDGKIDMCKAIKDLIADGRAEGMTIGRAEGRAEGISIGRTEGMTLGISQGFDEKTRIIVHNMLQRNMSIQDICAIAECSEELVKEVSKTL
ncbi:MAG: Rpn family recombination-promoting nuclease/putative transposase [Lachnospiraceae bacterium]|nr:Rpn family recombination-promoting nuclease/putative transposase [Lachnospiraceae bacterium]